jgi:UDP-N-acetylglucosamine--N-acetylmuramyl-(pentapeptide) pyrophosphoryl-undecaprenol N-acetylglucosamine transferase
MVSKKKKIAFCGGHHTSSLPIIDAILEKDTYDLIFIGRRNSFSDDKNDSLEYIDVQKRNLKFYELKAPKIIGKNIFQIFKIFGATFKAYQILKKENVSLVVSFGGYIAVPVAIASYFLGIKIITHEQTVVTGLGNKVIGYFANLILVTWPSSVKFFPLNKTKVIGLPLRQALYKKPQRIFNIINPLPTILITCGKTGSHKINKFILENLDILLEKFNIIHQSGDYSVTSDYQKLSDRYREIELQANKNSNFMGQYFLKKFLTDEEVCSAFSICDVVVSRSGAHTVYEILHFQKRALLIPISNVSHNEQFLNANMIYEAGLGLVLPEDSLNLDNFNQFLHKLLNNTFYLKDKNLKVQVSTDSTGLFLNEIQKIIN